MNNKSEKLYIARWYGYGASSFSPNYTDILACNVEQAREIAFKKMCDSSGDRLYDIEIFERRTGISCDGEFNPKPGTWAAKHALRDYPTGKINERKEIV